MTQKEIDDLRDKILNPLSIIVSIAQNAREDETMTRRLSSANYVLRQSGRIAAYLETLKADKE